MNERFRQGMRQFKLKADNGHVAGGSVDRVNGYNGHRHSNGFTPIPLEQVAELNSMPRRVTAPSPRPDPFLPVSSAVPGEQRPAVSTPLLEGFGGIYEKHYPRVYRYFHYRVGGQRAEAEDLANKAFLHMYEAMLGGRYEDRGYPIGAYLFRIAHNLVVNWNRDNGRHPTTELDPQTLRDHSVWSAPAELVERKEEYKELHHALDQLDPEHRQFMIWRHFEGLSNAEIAERTGKTVGAVKALLHRTAVKLRHALAF